MINPTLSVSGRVISKKQGSKFFKQGSCHIFVQYTVYNSVSGCVFLSICRLALNILNISEQLLAIVTFILSLNWKIQNVNNYITRALFTKQRLMSSVSQ